MEYSVTASRLRKAMEEAGINAATLELKSGIGKSSISHYYNGTHKPSNLAAEAMAEVLKVNPLWLMGFDVPEDRTMFLYGTLTEEDKAKVKGYIDALLTSDIYKKANNKDSKVS